MAASGSAFAATSNVDVYGSITQEVRTVDATASFGPFAINADNVQVGDTLFNGSKIGLKGSEDLGGGMSAIWQIESGIGTDAATTIGGRNTFVGLKGGLGTVLVGRHDTPEKLSTGANDFFADTSADYNSMIIDTRENDVVAYITPDFNGFHAAIATVAGEQAAVGATRNDLSNALSLTLVYKNGPLGLSYAKTTADQGLDLNGASGATSLPTIWGMVASTAATDAGDLETNRFGASYAMGDIKVALTHQTVEEDNGIDLASTVVGASYTMGPIVLKAQYGKANDKTASNEDATQTTVGVDYNLSKRTTAYALYSKADLDNVGGVAGLSADVDLMALGLKHSF
jgi:predicted porin